jgi:hypothetical protein
METAELIKIGRKEGQPGQRECELVDALRSERTIWFRFRLEGGAKQQVKLVEHGDKDIRTFKASADRKDLRVIVWVPRSLVTKKSKVALHFTDGSSYEFSLQTSTVLNQLKKWF